MVQLSSEKADSSRLDLYNGIAKLWSKNNPEKAILHADSAVNLAKQTGEIKEEANAYMHAGIANKYLGKYDKSLGLFQKSVKLYREISDEKNAAGALTNMGGIYWITGDLEKAESFYFEAKVIFEKVGDSYGLANCAINLGIINAIKEDYEKAEKYFLSSAELYLSVGDQDGATRGYNNLAQLEMEIDSYQKAYEYASKALTIRREIDDKYGICSSLITIGNIRVHEDKLNDAKEMFNEAYLLGNERHFKGIIKDAAFAISDINSRGGKNKEALEYYKIYTATKDSLFSESKSKEIGRLEANYEFEQKLEEEKRVADEQAKIATEIKSRKDNLQYSGIFVFVLILFAAVLMSGKFSMSERAAEGLIFFTFLLFFEFCLVLVDPFIDEWSSGEPLYKLLFNGVLAALIFPLHAFFENTIKSKLFSARRKAVSKNYKNS